MSTLTQQQKPGLFKQPSIRTRHVLSLAATEAMDCPYFLARFDAFKKKANAQVDQANMSNFQLEGEFQEETEEFVKEWRKVIEVTLQERAAALSKGAAVVDPQDLPKQFAHEHIKAIEELGYVLDTKMKSTLSEALNRFYLCDIGPAPFSVHAVRQEEQENTDITVTVSEHQLQVATHWLRHPPMHYTVVELEELIVLSLFHDVYYYDDFAHHGMRCVKLLEDYCETERPKKIVGEHIYLAPNKEILSHGKDAGSEDDELDLALQQEWVQMDWYLSMISMKQKKQTKKRIGDGVCLPLEFFHHHLGRFFTRKQVIHEENKGSEGENKPAWS